jgi:MoaA/NifB/PqqE/SkfB family radical SAM enzyme
MLTNTERLIEAIEYAKELGISWVSLFDSVPEAIKIIKAVKREQPEESQIITLLAALDKEEDFFELCTIEEVYKDTVDLLLEELEEQID